ncbi:bifunctional aspartate kinase/homoserine dehydrogenase I [Buchnera aphidicola]|uniref:bifunctional aspartate kinase/homoserine dehydrogenase I n=1 Tax=Buchnera aphidicola TaxID=9 RepID=UPI003BEF450C
MKLLKFGGTSLANAEKFLCVADIIEKNIKNAKIAVVLSAPAKITNYLVETIETIIQHHQKLEDINLSENIFFELVQNIKKMQPNFCNKSINELIKKEFDKLRKMMHGIILLKQCPDNIRAILISRGEILSVFIMKNILEARKHQVTVINPVKNLISIGHYLDSTVNIPKSKKLISQINLNNTDVILMAGFIAGNEKKELVVLGRNGSDYSAAILAACLNASCCEIWTDVDGVFTCDPREVSNSYLLESLSYEEAMELSYFGAKVLHPRTIEPISQFKIPCIIKNTNNLNSLGTLICEKNNLTKNFLKGVTHLDNIAMFVISGLAMKNMLNINARIFTAISQKNINIIIITQSSSENTINFCILENCIDQVKSALTEEFRLELKENILNPIHIISKLSILSIVGSNIFLKPNIASKIFYTLGSANINVIAIAQGSSKHSISLVLNKKNILNAVKIIHDTMFSNKKIITVFLIGIGGVGKTLIKQIFEQKHFLYKKNIDIKICLIANSKKMIMSKNGINLSIWENDFKKSKEEFNLDKLISLTKKHHFLNPAIVDCTSDQLLSEQYITFFKNGFHIITSNKKANTNTFQYYQKIQKTVSKTNKKFFYETNVGAGLPIISTLKNLLNTGDSITCCKGILSGSLSFIFGKLEKGVTFSQSIKEAQELGFTEPNPLDDLSGIDVARKILIIAREMGYHKELKDIEITPLLPEHFYKYKDKNKFLSKIQELDLYFLEQTKKAKKLGKVLRFVGKIDNKGKCQVKIEKISIHDPLYKVKNGENVLAFYTKYYHPLPLVLKGYGAGNNVTASGIFSNLLHTLS